MKNSPFVIGDEEVRPGEHRLVHLGVANLYSHDVPLALPVHVIRGKQTGPTMFISAAIHGDELNGVEVVRRIVGHGALRRLKGTLLAIPVVNGFGMIQRSRYLPDRRDLNRSFPGSRSGSLAARLANIFIKEIVERCDYGIDLHTGSSDRVNLPQVRADLSDALTRELADAFGTPVVINASLRDGSLRQVATDLGVRLLVFEAGEALRFDELSIRTGVQGVLRILRHVGMVPRVRTRGLAKPFVARSSSWVRAPATGVVNLAKRLGDHVNNGDVLARIYDPYDLWVEPLNVVSARNGLIVGATKSPLVYEGDALVHVAHFREAEAVAEEVEAFHQELLDDMPATGVDALPTDVIR